MVTKTYRETYRIAFIVLLTLMLSACAGDKHETPAAPHMTPLPAQKAINDPSNGQFMDEIAHYIAAQNAPNNTRYEFTRVDLNGDGRREGIALMKTPHKFWCEEYGCRMVVFAANNDGFNVQSEIAPVRGPFIVMNEQTNGWKHIMARVSGRSGWEAKNVILRYDGKSYPPQPAYQPSVQYSLNNATGGVQIFP